MIKKLIILFIVIMVGAVFLMINRNNKIGDMMIHKNTSDVQLNIDEIWGQLGDPVKVEQKFHELLPRVERLEDKSTYLQLLSQIALAQALQKKFDDAHRTLDTAQALLTPDYPLARVRLLLERGRVLHQADNIAEALKYFKEAFELGITCNNCDKYTIDAAHMIAIVIEKTEEKIKWNRRAIEIALNTNDQQAGAWLGSLYNNLGKNYMDAQQPDKALIEYEKALEYRKQEGYAPNIRVARWAIGCALRALGRLDEALIMQQALIEEYNAIAQSGTYDMPREMFDLTRGLVEDEIKNIERRKAHHE